MSEPLLAHRYRLLRSLGRGGMGEVWLANDTVQGGDVAVKVLTEQLARNEASILQTKQEFRLMTQLQHPNCCEVFDYGFLPDGAPYFTMEVVPGDGLDRLVPMSPAQFRPLLIQLLNALSYIHQRGYVHCDIKSENVRVRPDGTLKLMDFGLMIHSGANGLPIRGTLGYMPPEIIKRGYIDQRSDLYALGCLVYEMVTGQLPFRRAKPMEVLQAHLNEAPELRGRMLDDEDRDWTPIIAKLLAKDPIARYQCAEDVLEDLGVVVSTELAGTLLTTQIVGREGELAQLQKVLAALSAGSGAVLGLVGEEGVGKSRLVTETRIRAQLERVPVGLGTCRRFETVPFAPVVAAIRSLLPSLRELVPSLLDELAPNLLAILPELGGQAAPELDSPDKEKARLFDSVTRLMCGLTHVKGLVIAWEDWQWADALSAEFLAHLLRNTGDIPLLVLLTQRSQPEDAAWGERVVWLPLEGLSPLACEHLICSMLGATEVPAPFVEKMLALTGGNPQSLVGALEHLVSTLVLKRAQRQWQFTTDWDESLLPLNQLGLLHRRLSFVTAEALALAGIAALLGKPVDLAELSALSELPEERLFAAIAQLVEQHILRREEDGLYVLAHDALQPLLYDAIEPEERRRLHERAIRHLEAGGEAIERLPLEVVSQLARHAFGAQDRHRSIEYALEAGKRSTMLYANEEAGRLLSAGLALLREASAGFEGELLEYVRFLADVHRVTGRFDEAYTLYQEAISLAEAAGDALTLARILTSLAKLQLMQDRLDDALVQVARALIEAKGSGHGPVTIRALLTETRLLFYKGQSREAMGRADEALGHARALGHPTLIAQALSLRGYLEVASPTPDVDLGVQFLQEATARFAELGDRLGLYNATNLLANSLMGMGNYHEAWQAFEHTRQLAFELGAKDDESMAWLNLAIVCLEQGRLADASAAADKTLALASVLQRRFTIGLAKAVGAQIKAYMGEPAQATADLDEALALALAIKSKYMEMLVRQYQGETMLYLGRHQEALDAVRAWRALKAETNNTEGDGRVAALEGAALLALGRLTEAPALLAAGLGAAKAARAEGDEGRVLAVLARLALRESRADDAEKYTAEASALAERTGAGLLQAEIHGLQGELALAAGRPATSHFATMEKLARELGSPAHLAVALFGRAASSAYDQQAPRLVAEAQAYLEQACSVLDGDRKACFLEVMERRRVMGGNHIAFSLPSMSRGRRAPSGPLGMGMPGI